MSSPRETQARARSVVYGLFERYAGFVLVDADCIDLLVAEIAKLDAVANLGDLRALFPYLEYVDGPVHPADDEWPFKPDTYPLDLREYESWPPFAPLWTEEAIPRDCLDALESADCFEHFEPMMDTEFRVVPVAKEAAMLAALARHGVTARRDDWLISGLGS